MPARIHIVGIGSPFGDDRAGWAAIDLLSASNLVSQTLADVVTLSRCDSPADLLLDDYGSCDTLIVIDAICSDAAPGTIRRLSGAEAGTVRSPWSSHGFDVARALALGQTMHTLPLRVVLFGIELDVCGAGAEMSEPIRAALPELAARVEAELVALLQSDRGATQGRSTTSASNLPQ